ncbi:hypothetical protein FRC07_002122 [Ceratobasidium sp. 392]|nr:hypothetical protein FRC07_002122 [Ceratobasidium sp. 392]
MATSYRISSCKAETHGKRARMIATVDIYDDLNRDADFKDGESELEHQSPSNKRQRTSTTSTKTPVGGQQFQGKISQVVRLGDVPTGIFAKVNLSLSSFQPGLHSVLQIASQLEPIDIIFLARVNKSFRNLLMRRSSADIWRESMKNVPDLPDCPCDMSEPRYLALVFLKMCTLCGKAGKTEMNEVLRIRLCASCRETCLIAWDAVPPGIRPLTPYSGKIAPTPRRSYAYSLRADVPGLVAELEKIEQLNDKEAHRAWTAEKREIVQKRWQHAQLLREFLEKMGLVWEKATGDVKVDRQNEIERRLEKIGWTSKDMDFNYPGCANKRAWLDVVSQPKPLTDRGWLSLKAKLIPLLENNRKQRSEQGRDIRKKERHIRLLELFRAIKEKDCFTVELPVPTLGAPNPGLTFPITASYAPPFPDFSHTLNCPVVLDLYETDRSVTEMEAKFEENRKEIERHITEWTNRVQAHLTKLALKAPKITSKVLLATSISHDKESSPLTKLPDNVKRLLRADIFFNTTAFFSLGQNFTYGSILKYHQLVGTHTSTSAASPQAPPSLDRITWDSEANKLAQELLIRMGKPNVSYLEMTEEAIYTCGRCHDTEGKTWEQIVRHYVLERRIYPRIREDIRRSRLNFTYKDVHDPNLSPKQPLVQYTPIQAPDNDSEQFECKLCAKLIARQVVTSEAKVVKHLQDVHKITDPEIYEDYDPHITEEDNLDDGFSDEGHGCDYARHHLAGHDRYGRRRRDYHYYRRPRCAYDANGDDWS